MKLLLLILRVSCYLCLLVMLSAIVGMQLATMWGCGWSSGMVPACDGSLRTLAEASVLILMLGTLTLVPSLLALIGVPLLIIDICIFLAKRRSPKQPAEAASTP